jgi:hypothetical protein
MHARAASTGVPHPARTAEEHRPDAEVEVERAVFTPRIFTRTPENQAIYPQPDPTAGSHSLARVVAAVGDRRLS